MKKILSIALFLVLAFGGLSFAASTVENRAVNGDWPNADVNPVSMYGHSGTNTIAPVKVLTDGTTVMRFPSDSSRLRSAEITLPATIGNLHTHTFSDTAIGFTLKPRSVAVRYAVNATVAAVATDNDGTSTGASLAVGGIANADTVYTHTLPEGASRTLTLKGTTASPVVELVEF